MELKKKMPQVFVVYHLEGTTQKRNDMNFSVEQISSVQQKGMMENTPSTANREVKITLFF